MLAVEASSEAEKVTSIGLEVTQIVGRDNPHGPKHDGDADKITKASAAVFFLFFRLLSAVFLP